MEKFKNKSQEGALVFQFCLKVWMEQNTIKVKDGYKTQCTGYRKLFSFNELQKYFKAEYFSTMPK
jgi:hypothetical protein